jgi:hypothetical protein
MTIYSDRWDYASRLGRNELPWWLLEAEPGLTDEEMADVIADCWTGPEFPEQTIKPRNWVRMFRRAGYVHDDKPAAPPTEPVRLYRGCAAWRWRGMAWTEDRAKAEWFAARVARWSPDGEVVVAEALVQPVALLVQIDERSEAEYVFNTAMTSKVRIISRARG